MLLRTTAPIVARGVVMDYTCNSFALRQSVLHKGDMKLRSSPILGLVVVYCRSDNARGRCASHYDPDILVTQLHVEGNLIF